MRSPAREGPARQEGGKNHGSGTEPFTTPFTVCSRGTRRRSARVPRRLLRGRRSVAAGCGPERLGSRTPRCRADGTPRHRAGAILLGRQQPAQETYDRIPVRYLLDHGRSRRTLSDAVELRGDGGCDAAPAPDERVFDGSCGIGPFLAMIVAYMFECFLAEAAATPEPTMRTLLQAAQARAAQWAAGHVFGCDMISAVVVTPHPNDCAQSGFAVVSTDRCDHPDHENPLQISEQVK